MALPVWSSAPVAPYDNTYAEVYEREGIILETKHLSKARAHTFGRNVEWCDVILPKVGSISRQHAGLVHTKQGPVLIDLFSSHGATLNGTKLTAGEPYALHDGDVARFGESAFFKFKGTGRPKREAGAPIKPIVAPAGYQPMTDDSSGTAAQAAAGASTAATAAASSHVGDKRKSAASAAAPSSRKDARLSGPGLPNKTDRIRCRHVLVKHAGSRRPASWRQDPITLTKEEARARIDAFLADLIAGHSSAATLESRIRKLANSESDCSSAKHEGDLGFFEYKKMQPAFSEAAFKLRIGDVSPIVETDSGLHIIWRKE